MERTNLPGNGSCSVTKKRKKMMEVDAAGVNLATAADTQPSIPQRRPTTLASIPDGTNT